MNTEITKSIVVPLDGSENALKTLRYLKLIYGSQHNLVITLFHAIQGIPPILAEESKSNPDTARQVRELENRNKQFAKKILTIGKKALLDFGFDEDRIQTVEFQKQIGIARDICGWSENKKMDAIVLATRGRSRIEAFFMGETANKVLEFSRICPVWIVKENVRLTPVLIALDTSENAIRAVDHAAFMLAGTDCEITLFYSKRNLFRFFSVSEGFASLPELEETWQAAAGQEIVPTMQKAKQMLIKAGIEETQISVRIVDGSHNAASDILAVANRFGCGTIVMGRRGVTGVKEYSMGSVCRKVLQNSKAVVLWLVP